MLPRKSSRIDIINIYTGCFMEPGPEFTREKYESHTKKWVSYQSLPRDLFDEVHGGFDSLVVIRLT